LPLTFLKEVSEKLQGEKNLECSPLGEPCKGSLSFKMFQVKLKLDTPVKPLPS